MASVEVRGMDDLIKRFDKLIAEAPEMRREFHEKAGEVLKELVDSSIVSSGINDSHGTVRRWQVVRIGSKGGYAAVSAKSGAVGPNSAGAITNYLEHGHVTRTPSGRAKRYRKPRVRVAFVNGFHFYETAANRVKGETLNLAHDFVENAAKILEGEA